MNRLTAEQIDDYLDVFQELQLVVEYFEQMPKGQQYRVEFMSAGIATEEYSFRQFYDQFLSKGFTEHMETASLSGVRDDLVRRFLQGIGIETY